jgi:hypothetical protein
LGAALGVGSTPELPGGGLSGVPVLGVGSGAGAVDGSVAPLLGGVVTDVGDVLAPGVAGVVGGLLEAVGRGFVGVGVA